MSVHAVPEFSNEVDCEMRAFEFRRDDVQKFFGIELVGRTLTVNYGQIGTEGETKSREFADEIEATTLYDHLIAEKLDKGYVEVEEKLDDTYAIRSPDPDEVSNTSNDLPGDEFLSDRQKRRRKPQDSIDAPTAADGDPKPKQRKRSRRSPYSIILDVASGSFWRSALEHLLFMTGALAVVGGLLGYLVGLTRTAETAGLLFSLIGMPAMLFVLVVMSYPLCCFWKVIVGSALSRNDINEWPEGSLGEWVLDMLLVTYLVVMSLFLCAGVARLREVILPGQLPTDQFWQLIGSEEEINKVVESKFLAPRIELEVKSQRPILQPGPAWWTTFAVFTVIFPIVVISCLDSNTPILIPWSPQVLRSIGTNLTSWILTLSISGVILTVAAVVILLGSRYAPFWTFTLCSPFAAIGLLIYGRLLGRLSWQISRK